jgi:hypothetical protein
MDRPTIVQPRTEKAMLFHLEVADHRKLPKFCRISPD